MVEKKTVKGHPNYTVDRQGRVRNKTTGRTLKYVIDTNGYARVKLDNKSIYVRRLVCTAFRTTKFQEKNIAVLDNRFSSKKINTAERFKWGTRKDRTRRKKHAFLTPQQIAYVLRMTKMGWTQGRLAKKFNVSQPAICQIIKRSKGS